MATQQDQLIQAIRRIAKSDPEIRSVLTALQKRGALDGLVKQVGGSDAAALEDCCTNGDDADPEDGEPEDISEDAPPTVPDIGDEDGDGESEWSDCETGDPVTFAPGGFPQPETCKECERPDPTWEQGTYITVTRGASAQSGASLSVAMGLVAATYPIFGPFGRDEYAGYEYTIDTSGDFDLLQIEVTASRYDLSGDYVGTVTYNYGGRRNVCSPAQVGSGQYGCDLTDPPIEDQCEDWDSDNETSYTLSGGCITASSCDPDASTQSQQCNECITICNADGQERRVCAIGNGQWILYDPSGKYKGGRYDATGRRLEILPAGETGGYLPSEAYDGSYDGGTFGGGDGWVWN